MSRCRTFVARFAAVALLVAGGLGAQSVADGDLVLASNGSTRGVFHVDPSTQALRTLDASQSCAAVHTSWGNDAAWMLAGSRVFFVNAASRVSTVVNFVTGSLGGLAADQDARFWITNQSTGHVYRLFGSTATTVATLPSPSAICRDGTTGHFVVGSTQGALYRIDRETYAVTTLAQGLGSISGVAYLPSAGGRFAVSRLAAGGAVAIVDRTGNVTTTANLADANCVTFDERRNRIFAGGTGASAGRIFELTVQGAVVRTLSVGSGVSISGIDVWGDRDVSLSGTGVQGSRGTAYLSFPESPNRAYCVALSLANAPAIRVGGQHQHIAPDAIFFLTACGGLPLWTTGFAGTLDSGGVGNARFVLPYVPGLRLYVAASAVNPGKPGGLDVGNTEIVLVQ